MAKIKIFLEDNETIEEAQDNLYKALDSKVSGESHASDLFDDPAAQDLANKLENLHKEMYDKLLLDVFEALDQEYSDGY